MEQVENITNILDNKQRTYATGKRKNSIARVWLKRGKGDMSINGKRRGRILMELFDDIVPITVRNFSKLCQASYKKTIFHL